MAKGRESFTSLDAISDISRNDQTMLWTFFYLSSDEPMPRRTFDRTDLESLCNVVSANLGESADPEVVWAAIEKYQAGNVD